MKIKTFGSRCPTCQIDRIEDGFRQLGHDIIEEGEPDLIYCNNRWHEEPIAYKEKYPSAKLILNVLDIPEHVIHMFELDKLKQQLDKADQITCISKFVGSQLKKYYDIEEVPVIHNPMKDVYETGAKKDIPFLYVGRANDLNKRFGVVFRVFQLTGYPEEELCVVGAENPLFGKHQGVVSDDKLNELYNRAEFVFLPSKIEGIGLPMIEGIICNALPITCNDNLTAVEFIPDLVIDSNYDKIIGFIEKYRGKDKPQHIIDYYKEDFKVKFNKKTIAENIINVYNGI